jgi:hypothetical protein
VETLVHIVALAAAVLFVVALWFWQNWAVKRSVNRFMAPARAATPTSGAGQNLKPESDFKVVVSDAEVTCTRPDGKVESVAWGDLQKVDVLTTGDGPFVPDMFWVLYGTVGGCVVPWGATGESELIRRLQALPAFRNEAVVQAASLTTENLLHCWERKLPTS